MMTPERLAHLLRHDAPAVLERFGMFIFDEAQLLKESGRGFTLESTIALLDLLSRDTDHKIVLISAAMGNAGAIAQWLSPDGQALRHESQWRGPRRLHAAFTTLAHWQDTHAEPIPSGKTWPYRLITPLSGQIRLRMADGRTTLLSTQDDTGWRYVRKAKTPRLVQAGLPGDDTRSTKRYMIASEMIVELGHAGSVLVVANTRKQAQLVAKGLADQLDELPGMVPLVDFVRLQLGDDHPLVAALRCGVGFHHAGLPIEILEAIEEAVREDALPYLTCTSTLTDGINLPVRTVVIYDQTYEGQPDDAQLRGARLVNAIGRAGRAGKETEGWIVLVRAAEPTDKDFQDLSPDAEALAVNSTLTSDAALDAFAELEQQIRADEDAIFRTQAPATSDFISFVWLALAMRRRRVQTLPSWIPLLPSSTRRSPLLTRPRPAQPTCASPKASAAPTRAPTPEPAAAGHGPDLYRLRPHHRRSRSRSRYYDHQARTGRHPRQHRRALPSHSDTPHHRSASGTPRSPCLGLPR